MELEKLLPPGHYPNKYDDHIKTETDVRLYLEGKDSNVVYYPSVEKGTSYLNAAVKMPNNEIKNYQFVTEADNVYVISDGKREQIKSIDDFLEKKIFDEKMKLFSSKLGKDSPQAQHFAHESHLQFARNPNTISMDEVNGHLYTTKQAEDFFKQPDPIKGGAEPYSTGQFLITQPNDPDKKNTHLNISIKAADITIHSSIEFKNGAIYPAGKTDAAHEITDLSAHIQKLADDAAKLVDQANARWEQVQKLEKNLSKSQKPHYNEIEYRIKKIKEKIANGEITDQKSFDAEMDKTVKPSLLKIANRSEDYQRHKSSAFSKIKDAFRGKSARKADKIIRTMDEATPERAPNEISIPSKRK